MRTKNLHGIRGIILDVRTSIGYNGGVKKKPPKFSDQIRRAIMESGMSRYAIHKMTGLDQAALSRFVNGQMGLRLESLDLLADALGLEVVARRRKAQSKRKG